MFSYLRPSHLALKFCFTASVLDVLAPTVFVQNIKVRFTVFNLKLCFTVSVLDLLAPNS